MSDIDELMIQDLMDYNEVDRSVAVNAYNKILKKKPIKVYKNVNAIVDDIIEENNKKLKEKQEEDAASADKDFLDMVAECKSRNAMRSEQAEFTTITKEDMMNGRDETRNDKTIMDTMK